MENPKRYFDKEADRWVNLTGIERDSDRFGYIDGQPAEIITCSDYLTELIYGNDRSGYIRAEDDIITDWRLPEDQGDHKIVHESKYIGKPHDEYVGKHVDLRLSSYWSETGPKNHRYHNLVMAYLALKKLSTL